MTDDQALTLRCPITGDLARLRMLLRDYAAITGLSGQRLDDLLLASHEAAVNVLEHGGVGVLAARADAWGVHVDITDAAGTLTADQLNGAFGVAETAGAGVNGLYLIGRLCDAVELDHPGGHSRLRLHMRYQPASDRKTEEPAPSASRASTGAVIPDQPGAAFLNPDAEPAGEATPE
ncbi:ATP-binding protein [Nonomuraea ceibae]|uniref:ATP-binding protein n=1 Tax=Nonomuraea ceibae TaxID=1935170 RepID=UPI001C5F5435|nr:ATP-binding protein [Nonomuraea ceibae]